MRVFLALVVAVVLGSSLAVPELHAENTRMGSAQLLDICGTSDPRVIFYAADVVVPQASGPYAQSPNWPFSFTATNDFTFYVRGTNTFRNYLSFDDIGEYWLFNNAAFTQGWVAVLDGVAGSHDGFVYVNMWEGTEESGMYSFCAVQTLIPTYTPSPTVTSVAPTSYPTISAVLQPDGCYSVTGSGSIYLLSDYYLQAVGETILLQREGLIPLFLTITPGSLQQLSVRGGTTGTYRVIVPLGASLRVCEMDVALSPTATGFVTSTSTQTALVLPTRTRTPTKTPFPTSTATIQPTNTPTGTLPPTLTATATTTSTMTGTPLPTPTFAGGCDGNPRPLECDIIDNQRTAIAADATARTVPFLPGLTGVPTSTAVSPQGLQTLVAGREPFASGRVAGEVVGTIIADISSLQRDQADSCNPHFEDAAAAYRGGSSVFLDPLDTPGVSTGVCWLVVTGEPLWRLTRTMSVFFFLFGVLLYLTVTIRRIGDV